MVDSVVFRGGLAALIATVIMAALLMLWLPSSLGNARIRIAAFFIAWQVFTPIQESFIDTVQMLASMGCMEFLFRKLAPMLKRKQKEAP